MTKVKDGGLERILDRYWPSFKDGNGWNTKQKFRNYGKECRDYGRDQDFVRGFLERHGSPATVRLINGTLFVERVEGEPKKPSIFTRFKNWWKCCDRYEPKGRVRELPTDGDCWPANVKRIITPEHKPKKGRRVTKGWC